MLKRFVMQPNPFQNRPISRTPVHIIYRLHDSLPREIITRISNRMNEELEILRQQFPKVRLADLNQHPAYRIAAAEIKNEYQLQYDVALDQIESGPMFLNGLQEKKIVINSWLHLANKEPIEIYAISVMSNHVHVLLAHQEEEGQLDFTALLFDHKRYTAQELNLLHHQKGRRVWARNAFDRDVRKDRFGTVLWYILNNPVKAKLCDSALEWPGNYLAPELR